MSFIITTSDVAAQTNGVKVLIHGRAGSGKTPLCATAPGPLILSVEAGLLSISHLRIPTAVIRSIADLDEAYKWIAYSQESQQHVQTVCLDSISEIAEVCLAAEKARNKDPRKAYGETQDQVMLRMRWFRDLPKHVYFSAKQASVKDEVTGTTVYGPWMPGQKMGPQLPYLFDEVFSLEVARGQDGKNFSYLRTQRDPLYEARDRSGVLEAFEEPHLGKIFQKILAKSSNGR